MKHRLSRNFKEPEEQRFHLSILAKVQLTVVLHNLKFSSRGYPKTEVLEQTPWRKLYFYYLARIDDLKDVAKSTNSSLAALYIDCKNISSGFPTL